MRVLSGTATALTCVGAALALGAAAASAAGPEPRFLGPSFVYDDAYSEVLTKVTVHSTDRRTGVTLEASNFPRSAYGRTFGAHVHVDRCGPRPTDAGKHYQNGGRGTLRDRELWLDFTVDRHGNARVHTERPWPVKAGAANSVVVHSRPTAADGTAGDPILCTTAPFPGPGDTADKKGEKAEKRIDDKSKKKAEQAEKKTDDRQAKPERSTGKADEEAPSAQSSPDPKDEERPGRPEGPEHEGREKPEEHDGRDRHDGHGHQGEEDGRHAYAPWTYTYHPFIEWKPARSTARR